MTLHHNIRWNIVECIVNSMNTTWLIAWIPSTVAPLVIHDGNHINHMIRQYGRASLPPDTHKNSMQTTTIDVSPTDTTINETLLYDSIDVWGLRTFAQTRSRNTNTNKRNSRHQSRPWLIRIELSGMTSFWLSWQQQLTCSIYIHTTVSTTRSL